MIYSRLLHLKISCVPSQKEKQMLASHFSNPPRRSVSCQRRMPLQKSTKLLLIEEDASLALKLVFYVNVSMHG